MGEESGNQIIIGITAGWIHADAERSRYDGRPLLFVEQSMAEWVMAHGKTVPMMVPGAGPEEEPAVEAADFAEAIDGLIIQGGVDVAPSSYGEQPLRPEWSGDAIRDKYEIELVEACLERDRPILGICRGHQLLNVALGGTLYQDIATQVDGALHHRDPDLYHELTHRVVFEAGAVLRRTYGGEGLVSSVHHQAVRKVADGLCIEARSPEDGIVEAVRLEGPEFAMGVQWHPEFREPEQTELLASDPLLDRLVDAIRSRRDGETGRC